MHSIYFYGKELELCNKVKYLPVILDPKLSWKLHIEAKCNKTLISFHQLRKAVHISWGFNTQSYVVDVHCYNQTFTHICSCGVVA